MAKKIIKKAVKKVVKSKKVVLGKAVKKLKKVVTKKPVKVRLPSHVVPEKYVIRLEPDLQNFKFKGDAKIHLNVERPVKSIVLHAVELELEKAVLHSLGELNATKIELQKETETVELHFAKTIKGKHVLGVEYTGILNDKMQGFYRSKYKVGEETRYLATTQFESTYARQAFPCVDEPAAKAEFEFHLVVPEGKTAISNTEIVAKEDLVDGKKLFRFSPTPKMSTYLGAFMVGDFEYEEAKSSRGVIIRVHATPGKRSQMKFALDVATKCLDLFEEFFGVPYPLPTLDMIAIPDFSSAGMENWGAITYAEHVLLVDELNSSALTKQRVAEVVCHELAHMWFGNLVTMEWWTHLWLNEGFATWAAYYAMDKMFPEWHVWTQFMSLDYLDALDLDALCSTHPIEVKVNHPHEISEIFDAISYRKGASSIRMIANFLGEESFKKGIQAYMKKHAFGNTVTEDLWKSLTQASREDVRGIMRNWISKPGYPLLKISRVKMGIEIEQERFYASEIDRKKSRDKTAWSVPLTLAMGSESNTKEVLLTKKKTLVPVDWKKIDWVNVNFKHTTFSRNLYDRELLMGLEKAKEKKQLTARDRIGLISDLLAVAKSGQYSSAELLNTLSWFADEKYYTTWSVLAGSLSALSRILRDSKLEKEFNRYAVNLLEQIVERVQWDVLKDESMLDSMVRALVLSTAGSFGVESVVAESRKKFASAVAGISTIEADLRGAVYGTVATHGGMKEFEEMITMYRVAPTAEEKLRLAKAMTLFKPIPVIRKVVKFVLSEEVRQSDAPLILTVMGRSNMAAQDELWSYLKSHWEEVTNHFGRSVHYFERIVKALLENMIDVKKLKDAEQFLRKHPWNGGKMAAMQAVEGGRANVAWKKRAEKELNNYFKK